VKLLIAAAAAVVTLVPSPPGTVVQNVGVSFNAETSSHAWRAIASKEPLGSSGGREFYQWNLSIYGLRGGSYRLRYKSPGNGGPLSRVAQANGAAMWFPIQDLRIVGTASLMHSGVEQLVVQSHEMAADCGMATVSIFATTVGATVGRTVFASNLCDLSARIVHGSGGDSIELTGPYYGANAPACCPTKAHATAELRYANGKWVETPLYFKLN